MGTKRTTFQLNFAKGKAYGMPVNKIRHKINLLNFLLMNVQSIGENAGIIWRLLQSENRKWDYLEIKKATGLPDRDINASIGWLAREGKLTIDETKVGRRNVLYIELNYYIG